jgi:hypothetical protein
MALATSGGGTAARDAASGAELIARALRRHRLGIAQRQQRNDLGDIGIERYGHEAPEHWKTAPA